MQTLINLCGKYRKWIYGVLSVLILLLLLFPLRQTAESIINLLSTDNTPITHPYIARAFYWVYTPSYYNELEPVYRSDFWFELFSFIALILFVVTLICFWVREARGEKGLYSLPLLFAFISHLLLLFGAGYDMEQKVTRMFFIPNITFYLFIVLICLYAFAVLFGKLYPRMRPKVAETVTKVADKVKSHKSKAERIEELERQNAEMQKRLDEIERKK